MSKLLNSLDSNKILEVFTKSQNSCEAYQDFLLQRGVKKINLIDEIPISDKDNYFREYTLTQKMYRDVELSDYYMVCSSSGSTGEPTFWPRDMKKDELAEGGHTAFLDEHFQVLSKKSLIVIALDLGSTTAGLMHTRLSIDLAKKAKATIVTPGCRAHDAAMMIENLYRYYDQVILLVYPTLINEIIDDAAKNNFSFNKWNLKIGYTGSGASELWRLEIINKHHIAPSDIISFYGCTETGFIGVESKAVNNLINACLKDKALIKKLFKTSYLPTIIDQITPNKYFEVIDNELVVTVDQPIPLIRFNLHDEADILSLKDIQSILQKSKVKIDLSASKNENWLVVYGRKRNTFFSVEEVQQAIYPSNKFLKEFQYEENCQNGLVKMHFVLYKKSNEHLSTREIKMMESNLTHIFQKKHPCSVAIVVKEEAKRLGYKKGKLTYFL